MQTTDDRARVLADLRGVSTRELGRLATSLLLPALDGCAGPASLAALRLLGRILQEREHYV